MERIPWTWAPKMRDGIDFAGVVEFVEKRRKASGGYGATPRLPATIEDSFEALAIAGALVHLAPGNALVHPPAKDAALRDYLARALSRTWPGLRTTAQLIRAGRQLGLPLDREKGRDYLAAHFSGAPDFRTACYSAGIAEDLGLEDYRDSAWQEVRLPPRLTVREARMFLRLRKIIGRDPAREHPDLVAWLQGCQTGDGGFGFFPGTTSFIENCHYALAGLRLLGAKPSYPDKARRFLVSCQTGSGGFGRSPRAAPFLDATWHGLAALACLSD
jgi:hypothetical protein